MSDTVNLNDKEIAKARVICSLEGKLLEMEFFLEMIESEWAETLLEISENGQLKDISHQNRINYFFNGFSNSLQSIKDVLHAITGNVPWSKFSGIKNLSFIKGARNAIAHDGLQLVNTFNGGRYYVSHAGSTLIRYDDKGERIDIPCPSDDIVTVCKNFYLDLLIKIKEMALANKSAFVVESDVIYHLIISSVNKSSAIPDFVKSMIKENPTMIRAVVEKIGKSESLNIINKIDNKISALKAPN